MKMHINDRKLTQYVLKEAILSDDELRHLNVCVSCQLRAIELGDAQSAAEAFASAA